jgi:hypothetical protein
VENSHVPIIDKDVFDGVQKEWQRRSRVTVEKGRHSNRHVWSGKVRCAFCDSTFKRRINNSTSDNPQVFWQCAKAQRYGKEKINASGQKVGCDCKAIHEQFLRDNFLAVLNLVIENKDQVIAELKVAVKQAIDSSPNKFVEIRAVTVGMEKIVARKSKLLDLCVDGVISRAEFEGANVQYNKQLDALNKQLQSLKLDNKIAEDLTQKLNNIEITIETIVRLKEFSESVYGEVLSNVIVEGREKMSFYLTTRENTEPVFFKIPLSVPKCLPL